MQPVQDSEEADQEAEAATERRQEGQDNQLQSPQSVHEQQPERSGELPARGLQSQPNPVQSVVTEQDYAQAMTDMSDM